MRSVRVLLTATALGAAALLGGSACAAAAANVAGVWVSVNPSTVEAGSTVTVRASCGDDTNPATVSSKAFPSTTITPVVGVLSADVQVPATASRGTFDVDLVCRTGSKATTTLTVLSGTENVPAQDRSTIGPHTGGGFLATGDDGDGGLASGPAIWLAAGAAALVAAVVLSVRRTRPRIRRR